MKMGKEENMNVKPDLENKKGSVILDRSAMLDDSRKNLN